MLYEIPDDPKILCESLCAAMSAINGRIMGRNQEHIDRLQRLVNECDRHRPIGVNGKHGNLHTDTCGCEDKGPRETWGTVMPLRSESIIERLKSGDWSFGHGGKHHGIGTEECPFELHHHHDEFCHIPTFREIEAAGINPNDFKVRSRA